MTSVVRRVVATCFLVAFAVSGCGDQGPRSAPGRVTAVVMSPNGDEGAAWLTLYGEGIVDVVGADDAEAFFERYEDSVRVVVVDDDGGPLRIFLSLADTTVALSGAVLEVADPEDRLREPLAGYSVEFER